MYRVRTKRNPHDKQRPKIRKFLTWMLLCLAIAFLQPLIAYSVTQPTTINPARVTPIKTENSANLLEQGKALYQAGQFDEAIRVWQQATQIYQQQGKLLDLASTLSNLSLAYQKTGQWQEATAAVTKSLQLARSLESTTASLGAIAQALDTQGSLYLSIGKGEAAIASWKEAATIHEQLGDKPNQLRNALNQAQALKVQGFYRRSLQTLETINDSLKSEPNSLLKAVALDNLGDMLTTMGDLKRARQALEQSQKVLESLPDPNLSGQIAVQKNLVLLRLGNLSRAEDDTNAATEFYQKAESSTNQPLSRLQAQLNLFSLAIEGNKSTETEKLRSQIASSLTNLPTSRDAIHARINYAESLLKLSQQDKSLLAETSQVLAEAIRQAKAIDDNRTLSFALGSLGSVYEQNNQFDEAQNLTQQALAIAQSLSATDIAYRWQWQLGRILKVKGDIRGAIAAYSEAVSSLRQLRSDLAFVNSTVQFSFRESVEPVYRQLVSLLLQTEVQNPKEKQLQLLKAQEVIESLQLAELVNFFRADCLVAAQVDINQVDRTAAVIYPIILEDRLEVILSLPQQPLRHYATNIKPQDVDSLVIDLRSDLRDASSQDYLTNAQKLYDWLIRPAANAIAESQIKTMVFVLDGPLRNIPMSALHDGKQHLVEKYSIALTPGLQLLDPKPIAKQKLVALTGGLTEARQGYSALPSVQLELQEINKQVPASSLLLNSKFTEQDLSQALINTPFPIVHLATHGNFSSEAEKTYLLTYDGKINIEKLNQMLRIRNRSETEPIELLILSACQTAVGDKRAALGLAGMAVRAGARSTIASLWSVDDAATSKFMVSLYQHLSEAKTTKAESLRQAQLSLIETKGYNHPFFWAPFVLLGNWL
ncbi:CHAT domain-containing protein [Tumidithrix elongata RA019]|uniref:CHAT domain-containing protein n=1 Tax=Tumidithrix elongata BACA0141 TaxID=2716417 RepID=A0AAW9PS76_9CYAN|nr:CHAT domain-containing protein [Tumidithrix elongata RA019]